MIFISLLLCGFCSTAFGQETIPDYAVIYVRNAVNHPGEYKAMSLEDAKKAYAAEKAGYLQAVKDWNTLKLNFYKDRSNSGKIFRVPRPPQFLFKVIKQQIRVETDAHKLAEAYQKKLPPRKNAVVRKPAAAVKIKIDPRRPWVPAKQNIEKEISSAKEVKVEDILEPVKTTRYGGDKNMIWAPNPDGKTWDIVPFYYKSYGSDSTVSIIDLGSGKVTVNNYPKGINWHLCPSALTQNGKVYISVMRGPRVGICLYDPVTNKMTIDAVKMPDHVRGETHPLIRSTDGMIFAGGGHTSKAAALVMIDPRTNKVTDFGSLGPSHAPHIAYNYYMGADDTHVYIASGKVPWYLLAVDRKTKKAAVLAKTEPSGGLINVHQKVNGVTASVRTGAGAKRQDYYCYRGKLYPHKGPCPWKETRKDWEKALPPKPDIYSERALPESGKQAEMWVKQSIRGVATDPRFKGWSRFSYDVSMGAMGSDRLIEMPDGRIFGTAGSYAGHYIYDPQTGKCLYMGKTGLSHYATVIYDNKVWLSGYPSSKLFMFDCAKPWNVRSVGDGPGTKLPPPESPGNNPRLMGMLQDSGCHKMYGAAVGASGRIYFGGRWMRTGNGGGLGWWDTKAGEKGGIWKPFSNKQVAFMCGAADGKYIAISTLPVKDTTLKKHPLKEGKLVIYDDSKQEITREMTVVEGAKGPGPIVSAGGNRIIGWTNDPADEHKSILYGADVEKGAVVWKISVPSMLPVRLGSNQEEAWDFRLGPDGYIWTFMGNNHRKMTLVRIDPLTAKIEAIVRVNRAGRLAFSGKDVYLSGTTFLRRIKEIIK